jgi:hypothetical protein
MAADVEEVARHQPDCLGAEAATLAALREEEVDAGVAVLRVGLLTDLDAAGRLAVDLDREQQAPAGARQLRAQVVGRVRDPEPARDRRLGEDPEKRLDVVVARGTDDEPAPPERRSRVQV